MITQAAAGLPARALNDPDAVSRVRDCLLRVSWVDPESVRVAPDLPHGIRATYRPRTPRLVVTRGGEALALLASDGMVLPPGFDEALLARFLAVPLESGAILPEPGMRVSDSLHQEALAAVEEALWVRDTLKVPIVRIARRFDFPRSASGVPPALSFVCEDGREICWGWSVASERRVDAPDEVRISLERKADRLRKIVKAHPQLDGLSRVIVDRAQVSLRDLDGAWVEPPPGL